MIRPAWLAVLAALAAGGGGYWAGRDGGDVPTLVDRARTELAHWIPASTPASPPAKAAGPVVYYQDPDRKPVCSLSPMTTGDGREFRAVRASEDVAFDTPGEDAKGSREARADIAADKLAADGKVLYFRNPMGLPDTSPVPKNDSMGMDYIPVRESDDEGGTIIKVSPGKVQRTGVRSETVERRVLSKPVLAPGSVEEDERRISVIAMRTDAFVEKVEPVATGDHMRKGQPLLRLFAPEMNAVAAQYLTAIGYEGARRRLENLAIPSEVIDEIERTRKVPAVITWSAPRDGVIVERNVSDGMKAKSGDVLFRIVDHTKVWVVADVPERDLAAIVEGQKATVRARAFPGQVFTGAVTRIYPHLNMETRTARLRIEIANANGDLRPAMYADVEIATGTDTPVTAVPDDAVIDTGARQVVLLDRGEGRFEPREVALGARGAGFVEVRSGVTVGDRVVTSANFLIDAESNLKAALQALAAPPPAETSALSGEKPR